MTLQFGEQEASPDSILRFPAGLHGFEEITEFQLFHQEGKSDVHWLQAVGVPEVAFSVAEPAAFGVACEVTLSDEECAALQLTAAEDALVLLIVSRDDDGRLRFHNDTPLVINVRNRIGLQTQLTDAPPQAGG